MTAPAKHPLAAAADQLRGDYPALLNLVASIRASTAGTIGRSSTGPGIPGGVDHLALSREVRDVLWAYAEVVDDRRDLPEDIYSNAIFANARWIAAYAGDLDDFEALPCAGHDEPTAHASVTAHLECLARRVRNQVEPPGAREFVGPCPGDGGRCGLDLRAYDNEPAHCPAGHVQDAAAVRSQALAGVADKLLTLRQVAEVAPRLTDRSITLESLRLRVKRDQLPVRDHDETGAALVLWPDVRAAYRLG
ncbi:hypothetical protein [Pseudokineococcus lusitanus]|uniref:Uncharacterized protein n=1 Tax=Pseudokineococcus lusitanus TaxID=763993 RepID=A0A3N1HTS4_9ACTN|nr:hypothetical protein [Pseudokineococcus lusitanus]ROP45934.1 hypothetical protein EDC03_0549 [Pseudokineococcus lusitanus]